MTTATEADGTGPCQVGHAAIDATETRRVDARRSYFVVEAITTSPSTPGAAESDGISISPHLHQWQPRRRKAPATERGPARWWSA
jgi:hypothetical protein